MQIKTPIYQASQIREIERLALERFAITPQTLMQRAGKAAFDYLQRRWPQAKTITIFCGAGNNGGDGYVLALQAFERGMQVLIVQVGDVQHLKEEAQAALLVCQKAQMNITSFHDKIDLQHPEVIVDAICGIGVTAPLRENVISAIHKIQQANVPIFALDVPTGVDADTGSIWGEAVRATATMTFIGLKLGIMTGNGVAFAGEVVLNDLQLPSELTSLIEPVAKKIHRSTYAHYLNPRTRDWHKGLSGHVLVVGGDQGFMGAACLAAEAALRVGAGLVSVATRPEHASLLSVMCPEIMSHGIASSDALQPLLAKASVVIVGPGLAQSDWAKELWSAIVTSEDLPLVVDADGLNLLAQTTLTKDNWVLTPHPGEAGRLLDLTAHDIQADRLNAIKEINKRYGGVCVLKGAGTLVSAPASLVALCDKGNPGMATGGMGDVLSGVIGGLIAQGMPLGDAAKLGVYLHAAAGDLAAKDGERGTIASDLMPYLRRLAN